MKPPVEAPASSTMRPVTSISKRVRAWSSFSPPRRDEARRLRDLDHGIVGDEGGCAQLRLAADEHVAGEDEGARLLARGGEAAFDDGVSRRWRFFMQLTWRRALIIWA